MFLNNPSVYCCPFADFSKTWTAETLMFYTDASRNFDLGFGGISDNEWMVGTWGEFERKVEPSIEYLELFAVTAGVLAWIHKYPNW